MAGDESGALQEQVREALTADRPVRIVGGDSKGFMGRASEGETLAVGGHSGIVSYEPTELVITARAGTPLAELEAALAEQDQMLAFDPPHFGDAATLGGTVACGLSGPSRPYAGSARDFVLGCTLLNGKAESLRFGGEVMKNVAGYDVSRLMTGALGTLGVLLEVSLKVLPRPAHEITLRKACTTARAIETMNYWAGRAVPLSAAAYDGEQIYLRLSGAESAVRAAQTKLGGDLIAEGEDFWHKLREHQHGFFRTDKPLWRLSVPPGTPPLDVPGKCLLDWGGGQRWLVSEAPAETIRTAAERVGGHAALFRGGDREVEVSHPLPDPLMKLHRNLKQAFDPRGIFNPGRLYRDL